LLPAEKRPKQIPLTKIEPSGYIVLADYSKFGRPLRIQKASNSLDEPSIFERGNEYIRDEEYQKELEYYQKVIRDPNYSKAWNNKGIALGNLRCFLDQLFQ
jgi:tetratricopeptide (TPR) repeat protein